MVNRDHSEDPYRQPGYCIRSAREKLAEVLGSLDSASTSNAERYTESLVEAASLLQSAAALMQSKHTGDLGLKTEILNLRRELRVISTALVESDRLVTAWMGRIGERSGYTERGSSSPLYLVPKVNVTG